MRILVLLVSVLVLTFSSDGKEIPKEEDNDIEENNLKYGGEDERNLKEEEEEDEDLEDDEEDDESEEDSEEETSEEEEESDLEAPIRVGRQIRPFGAPAAGSARCPIITGRDVDDSLTQSEAIRRLGVVYGIMDRDGDGVTSEEELAAWFGAVIGRQLDDEVDRVWGLYDVNGAGRLSWDMRLQTYNAVQGRPESELDPTCQTYLKMMSRDERRWKRADQDNDGFLSRDEFAAYLYPADFDFMYETVVEDFIDEYDTDSNGGLSLSEFTSIFGSSCGVDSATLQGQFRSRDTDGDGQLGVQELITWVIRFGYDSNQDQAARLVQDADTNADGRLSLQEIQAYYGTVLSNAGGDRGDAAGAGHRCSFAFLLYWHIHNTFTDGYWQNWSWATYRPRTYTGFGSIATITGTGGGRVVTTGGTVTGGTGTGGIVTTGGGGTITTTTVTGGGTTGGTTTGGRGVVIYDYTETGTGGDRLTPDGGVVTYSTDDRGGGVSYTIDAQGRKIFTTADGQRYFYDEQGNIIYITTATITTEQRYYIDADGNRVYIAEDGRRYREDASGNRIYITTGGTTTTTTERFIVDAQGNRIYTGADGRRYRLDAQGSRIYISTTGGGTVTTTDRYIIDSQGNRIFTGADGRRYRYGPDGNIIYITTATTGGGGGTFVSSTTDSYVVDAEGNRVYTGSDGRRYIYGTDGRIIYIVVGERYTTADGRAYTYDANGRIVYYTEDGRTYRYDAEGNLLYVTLSAGGTVTTTGTEERFTVDPQGNRIEFFTTADGRRYTYDSAGNILYYTDDGRAYRYDNDGQIVYVTSGGEGRTVTFVGSGFENRNGVSGGERRFRVDASGNVVSLGDQPAGGRRV